MWAKSKAIPAQAWTDPEGSTKTGFEDFQTFTLQKIFLVLISVRDWVNPRVTERPVELSQWKIPMTPPGAETAAFRLAAQCLQQLRHRVRHDKCILNNWLLNAYLARIVFDGNLLWCPQPGAYNNRALYLIIWPVGDVRSANCGVHSSRYTGHHSARLHHTSARVDVVSRIPRSSPRRKEK